MEATGAILAGGRSSRMKSNKAFVEIAGQPVIKIILDKFTSQFEETIIISNDPELFTDFGHQVFIDIYPRLGPVSGIHSALYHARYDNVFIMGCDMPFMKMELAAFMLAKLEDYDSVVPQIDSNLQPLSAAYNRRCLPLLTNCLEQNHLKLTRIFREELNALILERNILERFGNIDHMFLNINDSETLCRASEIVGRLGL
jgi:molybdopterin-guanine dinucleotide biosynthesis protein A